MSRKYVFGILIVVLIGLGICLYYTQFNEPEPERILDPTYWEDEYPAIFKTYARDSNLGYVKFGGEQQIDYIKKYPNIKTLYAGYGFSKEYFEARGHIHTLEDVNEIGRPKGGASCLACKTAEYEGLYQEYGDKLYSMDFDETADKLEYPITCYNCHENNPGTININVPHALAGFDKLDFDIKSGTKGCAQCHVEYYVNPENKEIIFPWDEGITIADYEKYYDDINHTDWEHPDTGTPLIKIQHPEFEMYQDSVHDKQDMSCKDCHMPSVENKEGEEFVSHWMTSPLKTAKESCFSCHGYNYDSEEKFVEWVNDKQQKIEDKEVQTSNLLVKFVEDFSTKLEEEKLDEETIEELRSLHRSAQMHWDFIFAENSTGSHNFERANEYLDKAQELSKEGLNILANY